MLTQPLKGLPGALVPHSSYREVILEECRQQPGSTEIAFDVAASHPQRHLFRPGAPCIDLVGGKGLGTALEDCVETGEKVCCLRTPLQQDFASPESQVFLARRP